MEGDDWEESGNKEVTSDISATTKKKPRFHGDIFTIVVEDVHFTAHQSILSRSPVFASMCCGPFREGEMKMINLPTDNVEIFGALLESLYSCEYELPAYLRCGNAKSNSLTLLEDLANLYIMTDKYQVHEIQMPIVETLSQYEKVTSGFEGGANRWFGLAERIYSNVPSKKGPFFEWFEREAPRSFGSHSSLPEPGFLYELLLRGDSEFAAAISMIQSKALDSLRDKYRSASATIENLNSLGDKRKFKRNYIGFT